MPKKRTIQQKAEAKAKGELKSLLSEWVVNELSNDFGIDFEVRIADDISHKTQEISEISFYIQSKSTIKSKINKAEEDLSIKDWKLYLGQRIPVVLLKYDINQRTFYWEIIQEYAWDVLDKEDPNWKRKRTKRIVLYKKLGNLDELKKAVINAQNRITRFHSLNLGIGEGIKITEDDLTELEKSKDKLLFEYKALTLKESYLELKKGNSDKSFQLLMDVYNSPKNDEAKIRAIIGIIFEFNIAKPEENQKIVALANEAIKIASELKIEYLRDYIEILKNQALFYVIIKKMSEIQMSLQVQNLQNEQSFSFFTI